MIKSFEQLIQEFSVRFSQKKRFVIAIDGFGGSGKSTLAKRLLEKIPSAEIVRVDEFYEPIVPGGENDFHWERFEKEIIDPIRKNLEIRFKPYDWKSESFHDEVVIDKDQPVIIEGVYCTQKKFCDACDVKVWIDVPEHIRFERGMARDGEEKKDMWENVWLPYTRKYMEEHRPDLSADFVIDGVESDFGENRIVTKSVRVE